MCRLGVRSHSADWMRRLSRLRLNRLDLAWMTADGDSNRTTADGTVLDCGVRPTFRIGLDGEG
jgi:hypothetical protein